MLDALLADADLDLAGIIDHLDRVSVGGLVAGL